MRLGDQRDVRLCLARRAERQGATLVFPEVRIAGVHRSADLTVALDAFLSGCHASRLLGLPSMPRHWFWMQVAIVVFVLAGMVIAITKLA
jgi:hypothetical protein